MGVVVFARKGEPPLDRRARVCLEVGQMWVEKGYGVTWVISDIEVTSVNDKEKKRIYLQDPEGTECASSYTESYFRRWFYEIGEPLRKANRLRLKSQQVHNLDLWQTVGPVIARKTGS